MTAHAIFDVEVRDMARYQEFMKAVKPEVEAAECSAARLVAGEGVA